MANERVSDKRITNMAPFRADTIVDNFNGRLECYGNKAKDC